MRAMATGKVPIGGTGDGRNGVHLANRTHPVSGSAAVVVLAVNSDAGDISVGGDERREDEGERDQRE